MRASGPLQGAPTSSIDDVLTFGVLGPLEVRAGATLLNVRGPQERALLALLLTAPGRVFSVPAIVAGIWGDDPPAGAEKTVQSYVSRLRRTLPGNGSAVLLTRSPGYVAAIEPAHVDAERFRSMVATGRHELAAGQPENAAATLRSALALWRGDAYAEFGAPFAAEERTVLEELRLAVVEDRVAADLEAGAGSELVGELEALVARHPWRERLWGQLMTALYRSGRQGDALLAFQRARASLVDELGVEPGPDLQAIEAMVLAQDPLLDRPARSGSTDPLILPVTGQVMVGRDAERVALLDAYDRAAAGSVVRVLLVGPHGIGKTRLMAEVARDAHMKGGLLLGSLPGPATAGTKRPRPGSAAVVLLDDLQQATPADLAVLSDSLSWAPPPLFVVGACVWDALDDHARDVLAQLFPGRRDLKPLRNGDVEEVVRLYVPPEAVADAVAVVAAAGGVPLQVHAAASRYGEQRAAAEISAAAAGIPQPRRGLDSSRDRVADGVLELQRVRLRTAAHAPDDRAGVLCPYKGLAYFGVDDAPYFFGRERLVARLVARLVDAPLLAVVGASGSGKSSAIRAGLIATVAAGTLPGSARWHIVVTSPTQLPPELPSDGVRTLLVVDQFEEMFTALSTARRDEYFKWLMAAASADGVTAVVAVRSDYYGHVSAHPDLAELMAANTVLVGSMSAEELTQAVELPAAAAGLEVEAGLAQTVTGDVAGEPGGLPLLSTAMLSLWERRDGRRLSLAAYHELGGVRSAVAQLAEQAYDRLSQNQQGVARRILLRLAETGDGGEPVRRRVSLAELAVDTDPDARIVVDALAARRLLTVSETHAEVAHEALLREWPRLSVWLEEDESGRRLRRHLSPAAADWDSAGRDSGELYRGPRLAAALDWARDHPDDLTDTEHAFLRAGREFAEAEAVRRRRSIRRLRGLAAGLAGVLVLALVATVVAVDRQRQADRSAEQAAASALLADARALREAAVSELRLDLALLYTAQAHRLEPSSASRAALLQVVQRSPEATAVFNANERLQHLTVSADGGTLATIGSEGTAYAWDTGSGQQVATLPRLTFGGGTSVDLSPDGRYLMVVGIPVAEHAADQVFKNQVVIVDLVRGQPAVRTLASPALSAARFASGGRTVVTLGVDGRVRYVDPLTGLVRRALDDQVIGPATGVLDQTVVLDGPANRRYLVAADAENSGPVTAWQMSSGRLLWSSRERGGTAAAISPDGSALVLGHEAGRVEYVDLDGARQRRTVVSLLDGGAVDVDWAPNGSTFAATSNDGSVTIWDADTLDEQATLRGHTGIVTQAVYSPDGHLVYASGEDRSVLAWDRTGKRGLVERLVELQPTGYGHQVVEDGSLVASFVSTAGFHGFRLFDVSEQTMAAVRTPWPGSLGALFIDAHGEYVGTIVNGWPDESTGVLRVVDIASGSLLPYSIRLAPRRGFDAAFTGNGRSLLVADDRRVVLRNVRSGQPVAGVGAHRASDTVSWVAADETGRIAALNLSGGGIEIADLQDGRRVTTLDTGLAGAALGAAHPLRFSPDGRWFAAGSGGGRIAVWDTGTWQLRSSWVAVPGGAVDSLAFTGDSRHLVAGGAGTASVWDVEQGDTTGATIDVDPGASVGVGARDDGRTIVTATDGTGVQLWNVAPESLVSHACQVAGRNLTREEWEAVLPDRPYEQTCPEHPAG